MPSPARIAAPTMTGALTLVFAFACGSMVANLYYGQALIGLIAPALHLHGAAAGMIVTATQFGYGLGLLLVVSLADLVENRRLMLIAVAGAAVGLIGIACSVSPGSLILFCFITGFCSVGAQVMVPFAAHLAPDATRGRVLGNIMAGLLAGIMLARPAASFLAAVMGWRAIFWLAAAAMVVLGLVLLKMLPRRKPQPGLRYGQILASSLMLMITQPLVRRRSFYQAGLFCVFNMFWTAAPLLLADRFHLDQTGIGLFAFAGAAGALIAPIAGRLGDRGRVRSGTLAAILASLAAMALTGWAVAAVFLAGVVIGAIVLDGAVQMSFILGQKVIYALAPDARGRINAIYTTTTFTGGAAGSALAGLTYYHGGWSLTALTGAGVLAVVLGFFLTEFVPSPRSI